MTNRNISCVRDCYSCISFVCSDNVFFHMLTDTSRYVVTPDGGSLKEPYDHGKDIVEFHKVTEDFKDGMSKDKTITAKYDVKMITKV